MPEVVVEAVFGCDLKETSDLRVCAGAEMVVGVCARIKILENATKLRENALSRQVSLNDQFGNLSVHKKPSFS